MSSLVLLLFGLVLTLSYVSASVSVADGGPPLESWDEGRHHVYAWKAYVTTLTLSVFLNVVIVVLFWINKKLRNTPNSLLVIILSIEDIIWNGLCLIVCSINLHNRVYGDENMCRFQAMMLIFVLLCISCTLCLIAYASDLAVKKRYYMSTREIIKYHIGFMIYATIITIIMTVAVEQPRLYSGGTFCFTQESRGLGVAISWTLIFIPIIAFLAHRYFSTYQFLMKTQQQLANHGIHVRTKVRETRMAQRMAVFVIAYFLCVIPMLLTSFYELIWSKLAPPWTVVWAGVAIHTNSIFDALLYFWTNSAARAAVLNIPCIRHTRDRLLHPGRRSSYVTPSIPSTEMKYGSAISQHRAASLTHHSETQALLDLLSDPVARTSFQSYCEHEYNVENVLFWIQTKEWEQMAYSIYHGHDIQKNEIKDHDKTGMVVINVHQKSNDPMSSLESLALKIVQLFLLPTSLLQVNFSGTMTTQILSQLRYQSEQEQVCLSKPLTMETVNVFHLAREEAFKLLLRNAYPRWLRKQEKERMNGS